MPQGYIPSLLATIYRATTDGRRVVAKRPYPLLPLRWYYVEDAERAGFERRFVATHLASTFGTIILAQNISESFYVSLLAMLALLIFMVMPVAQLLLVRGLTRAPIADADLVPVTRAELEHRATRAMGPRLVRLYIIFGLLMLFGQVMVIITDGALWAWGGALMFAAMTIYFVQQLRILRADERAGNGDPRSA
jgi:hypothetical protein